MATRSVVFLLAIIAVASAFPVDHVIAKMDPGPRYQYVAGSDGDVLVDLWLKTSDVLASARYKPEEDVGFHLFTRANRYTSQPISFGADEVLKTSNFDPKKKTVVIVHGWNNTPQSDFNVYMVNYYLVAEDVNLIMVDWSVGAIGTYLTALSNAIRTAEHVAEFITWLNLSSGADITRYHIVGHSLGGHQAGIIGRHLGGRVPYITSLDPALPGWITNPAAFKATDGVYTEVIHTDAGVSGLITPAGDVDFYPNGGSSMPGCSDRSCNHHKCVFYMAESLVFGGFTGQRCDSVTSALAGNCDSSDTLKLGGLIPKTGQNPSVSQPLLIGVEGLLGITNYNPSRRTVVLIHGWLDSATSDFNTVLVPAFLSAEDVNVIVVDWSAGAGTINYVAAVANTVPSGESVAKFIDWLNSATGAVPTMYHLVGHSLGGHQVGIIGRNLGGRIAYITALDPALPGWTLNDQRFTATDGEYTEVIHTNAGLLGYAPPLGDVDFYPNGGVGMPGCSTQECDHARSYFYLAETLTSGGFTGRRCLSYLTAMTGNCHMIGWLRMGGLVPKTGQSGIFYLETNASPPFSQS